MKFASGRNPKLFLVLLLLLGTALQGLVMFRSGLKYNFGLGFWGPNGYDGVWHLALANQVLKSFPPPHPTFAGAKLINYHFLFDIILALLSKATHLSVSVLYFQILPVFFSLGLGILSFWVGYLWRKDWWTGFWLAFLNYFAGSFGYLVTLLRGGGLGGESLFWSMQSISTLINPPFALSLLAILGGLILLVRQKLKFIRGLALVLLFGLLVNLKSYAGVVGFSGLAAFSFFKWLNKEKKYAVVFFVSLLVALVTFLPVNQNSKALLVFQPLWFVNSMIESSDRLYLPQIALARYSLLDSHRFSPRLILIEALGILVFILGNLGTRILGLVEFIKKFKRLETLDFFLLGGGIVALIVPIFFVQKGTAWNTIQFFYYFLFFANFYFAAALSRLIQAKSNLKYFLLTAIILLTIPTSFASLKDYFGWPPPASLPLAELEGLAFLRQQPEGVVLTFPYSRFEKDEFKKTPLPLRVYAPTAYVSAFSGKQTFLEETNLDILGYQWQTRKNEIFNFFSGNELRLAKSFLRENKIRYLYLVNSQRLGFDENKYDLKEIFDNSVVQIYQADWEI